MQFTAFSCWGLISLTVWQMDQVESRQLSTLTPVLNTMESIYHYPQDTGFQCRQGRRTFSVPVITIRTYIINGSIFTAEQEERTCSVVTRNRDNILDLLRKHICTSTLICVNLVLQLFRTEVKSKHLNICPRSGFILCSHVLQKCLILTVWIQLCSVALISITLYLKAG